MPDSKRLAVGDGQLPRAVHGEDVVLREPAHARGLQRVYQFTTYIEEGQPGRSEQILERAAGEEIYA